MAGATGQANERWVWRTLPQGWMAFDQLQQRCLLGVGAHWYRPWVYPLYTPAGHQVLQEFAFDHPFHNGCFAGLHPVVQDGRASNFWATPPQRQADDPMLADLGRVVLAQPPHLWADAEQLGALLTLDWRAADGQVLLHEQRTLCLRPGPQANQLLVSSEWTAAVDVALAPTKFAGLGVRLDPALTQVAGARYAALPALAGAGRDVSGLVRQACLAEDVPVDALHGGMHAGVRIQVAAEPGWGLVLHQAAPAVPWFVRGYGLVLHNPVQHQPVRLAPGQNMAWSITLTAYDAGGGTARDVS
ncbi:MAG: DUF6807 family protein [Limnohabitans sp.]